MPGLTTPWPRATLTPLSSNKVNENPSLPVIDNITCINANEEEGKNGGKKGPLHVGI